MEAAGTCCRIWGKIGMLSIMRAFSWGRDAPEIKSLIYFPDHRSQVSQGSSALALLPPVQVPLGPTQKQKYCHHVFTLNQCSLLTLALIEFRVQSAAKSLAILILCSQIFC